MRRAWQWFAMGCIGFVLFFGTIATIVALSGGSNGPSNQKYNICIESGGSFKADDQAGTYSCTKD